MKTYILQAACIAPGILPFSESLEFVKHPEQLKYLCASEPEYYSFPPTVNLRRIPRMGKIGLACAQKCTTDSESAADAIFTGTGMAMMDDSEEFLKQITGSHPNLCRPTPFIHSTHHLIPSLIAKTFQITGPNINFIQQAHSFESAFIESLLFFSEQPQKKVLLGSFDEINSSLFNLLKNSDSFNLRTQSLEQDHDKWGEGVAFFLLSDLKPVGKSVSIREVKTLPIPKNKEELLSALQEFLSRHTDLRSDEMFVLSGEGSKPDNDFIQYLAESELKEYNLVRFKEICGEYFTSSSFAIWLGYRIMMSQNPLKDIARIRNNNKTTSVLILQQVMGAGYSIQLLELC